MKKILNLIDAELIINSFVTLLPDLLVALAILFVFWFVYRISRKPLGIILQRAGFHENLIKLLVENIYKFLLMFLSVIIPNKSVIDEVLVNHSKHGATRIEVPIGIAYKENISEARKVILKKMLEIESILKEPAPDVVVMQLGSSSVEMMIRVWIDDAKYEKPVFSGVMEASKIALDEAGIEIPYPHLQLFIENVEDRVWEKTRELSNLMVTGNES